jgi:hypothetical protein
MSSPSFQQNVFPTVDAVCQLWRSLVNDTFPGLQGTQGRIATNSAPFTLPFLNDALKTLQRKLRNEGVTFPIKDFFVINNLPPVVAPDPSVIVSVGYDGYFNGTSSFGDRKLPGDLMQLQVVRQRVTGSNLQFSVMKQSEEGLASGYQNNWLGQWEFRNYKLYMNGSLQPQDIMLRYTTGQPPINAQAADFPTTNIYIIDCETALANLMAGAYGAARGANDALIQRVDAKAQDAIDDMALEYVRRQQTVSYNRPSYKGGGSENDAGTQAGSSGVTS